MTEQQSGGVLPATNGQATETTVTQDDARERARRRWRLHQQFSTRRRITEALDRHCGIEPKVPGEVDYSGMGFDLGYAERRAAGLRIREQEAAA